MGWCLRFGGLGGSGLGGGFAGPAEMVLVNVFRYLREIFIDWFLKKSDMKDKIWIERRGNIST